MAHLADEALRSTLTYLESLETSGKGGKQCYRVELAAEVAPEERVLDGAFYWSYVFRIDRKLRINPDTSLNYLAAESPAKPVRVVCEVYDRERGRIVLGFPERHSSSRGMLEIDYRFLIHRMREWLEKHGDRLSTWTLAASTLASPQKDQITLVCDSSGAFPNLSGSQRSAISNALESRLSYCWGPPGSGKTDYALSSTALILAHAKKRVLVLAPTHNAVDHALRSILTRASKLRINPHSVIRLGLPTPDFAQEFPENCEDRELEKELMQLKRELALRETEKALIIDVGRLHSEDLRLLQQANSVQEQLRELTGESDNLKQNEHLIQAKLCPLQDEIQGIGQELNTLKEELSSLGFFSRLFGDRHRELKGEIDRLFRQQSVRQQAASPFYEALARNRARLQQVDQELGALRKQETEQSQSQRDIQEQLSEVTRKIPNIPPGSTTAEVDRYNAEITRLQAAARSIESRLGDKLILGMTLDGFIGRSLHQSFRVDWVLVDEAAYAALVKMLPLLVLGTPISLFGDHRQLPPVCEADDKDLVSRAFWGTSALFVDSLVDFGGDAELWARLPEPEFRHMSVAPIVQSYRFGMELAGALDKHIYQIGLQGCMQGGTTIEALQVPAEGTAPPSRRVNRSEAQTAVEVVRLLLRESPKDNVVVLTPYKAQVREIERWLLKVGLRDQVEVLNTHRAQGREWDTVVFSAVDGSLPLCAPHFTSSRKMHGRSVLNTTISRVRKRLVLVLEKNYWALKKDELLGDLLTSATSFSL